ncbi:hypothetical protein [Vibrio crassostreae]|uniref:hypothetical protein n=1 Tax=Vibrio crassostreae TaxID=246167 RepID=UPI001B311004|nr:hypothetical protein [Vibrio crassostreae]
MFKKFYAVLFLLLVSASSAFAASADMCGIDEETGRIKEYDHTICPQDVMMRGVFSLFPDLTIRAIDNFGLEYADDLKKALVTDPIASGQRKLQNASWLFHRIALIIISIFLAFSVWTLIWETAKGKEGQAHKSVNFVHSLPFLLLGTLLMLNIDGFYVYQWVAIGCFFVGLGFSNFMISTYAYFTETYTQPSVDDAPVEVFTSIGEASLLAEREVDLSICINQLVANDIPRTQDSFLWWSPTPTLDTFRHSIYDDDWNSPMEVFMDGDKVIVDYGSGTGETSARNIADWWKGRSPQSCGRESVLADEELLMVVRDVKTDFSNSKEVYQKWALGKLNEGKGDDEKYTELVVNSNEDVSKLAELNEQFHKGLMSLYRNPVTSNQREKAFLMATEIAENVRRYNCLLDPLGNIVEVRLDDYVNLSCASSMEINEITGTITPAPPYMFYTKDIIDGDKVEIEKDRLKKVIKDGKLALTDFHIENTTKIYQSYLDNRFVKNGHTITSMMRDMRQHGLFNFGANFIITAVYMDNYVRTSAPYEIISPQIDVQFFGDYYIPDIEKDGIRVGKILHAPGAWNALRTKFYGKSEIESEISAISSTKNTQDLDARSNNLQSGYKAEIEGLLKRATSVVGLGFTDDVFEGSDFILLAGANNWSMTEISNQFLSKCFAGQTTLFNRAMIAHCTKMLSHPISILKSLGESLFYTGAMTLITAHATNAALSVAKVKMRHGGVTNKVKKQGINDPRVAETLKKLQTVFSASSQYFYWFAWGLISTGVIFAYVIPYTPVFAFTAIAMMQLTTMAIGVIFGSILLYSFFRFRIKGEESSLDNPAFRKLCTQLMLGPVILTVVLVTTYLMLDVAIKLSMQFASMFIAEISSTEGSIMIYFGLITMSIVGSLYVYYKIANEMVNKVSGFYTMLLKLLDLGAHSVNQKAADGGGVMNAVTIGAAAKAAQSGVQISKKIDGKVTRAFDRPEKVYAESDGIRRKSKDSDSADADRSESDGAR